MIHRSVQFSILLSLSLVLIAQVAFAPVLLSISLAVIVILLGWRYRYSHLQPIAKVLQILWLGLGLSTIYLQYQTFIGVEAGVAVLTTILFAKALETRTARDVIVLFNFALFVSASLFLYSQSVWMALLILTSLMSCLLGLYRLQQAEFTDHLGTLNFKQDAKRILQLSAYAVPFFVLLFLFFPRLPPLWHIPIQNQQGVTGISDQMSPGDIAQLSQSSALAFRIITDTSRLPPRSEMYWRALALDQYDGVRWTSHVLNSQPQPYNSPQNSTAQSFEYQLLPADQRQIWIPALQQSQPLESNFQLRQDGGITPLRTVQRSQPIRLRWIGPEVPAGLDFNVFNDFQHKINTTYPARKDLRAQRLAQQMLSQSRSDPHRYIDNILRWYQRQGFKYTLNPGRLGEQRIDEFLFQSRQGFCEHYASSFVMLMRYAGIPARVVVGYQGGQLAPDAKSWEVRQLDAHAWAEVWLNGRWQSFDPTALIAPQRIDQGMQELIENDQQIFGSESANAWKYQQFALLKNLRIWSDYASYQWQRNIIGYDSETQKQWLSRLGLHSLYSTLLVLCFGGVALGLFYFVILKLRARQRLPMVQRLIMNFSKCLPRVWQKQQSETFEQWMRRLMQYCPEMQQSLFQRLIQHYQKIVFMEQRNSGDIVQLKKMLKDCTIVLRQVRKTLSEK